MEIKQTANNILTDRMTSYSAYVLLNRAIPRFEDGQKPVGRRILYSMFKHKSFNYTKSANVAGRIMMIHPHGSAYPSMVGMVQSDRQSTPLLEGKGNFGQYTSSNLQPAADRYSEVRLSKLAISMMQNFDKNLVDFEPNYDGTQTVPTVLPVKYPTILTQAQKGIGVGFSSSTASYNLKEVCQATIDKIDGKDIFLIPDFATGGYIEDNDEAFKELMVNGHGGVNLRAKYTVDKNEITITEIPYGVKREKIIDDIIKNIKNGKFSDIKSVNDLTGLNGMDISITLKKNANVDVNIALLFKHTQLESKYSVNNNILIDDKLKVVGVDYILEKWIEWRKECIKRGLVYDVEKLAKKVHLYQGLETILLDIDKAIEIIRNTDSKKVVAKLKSTFKIDDVQSEEVLKMQLRNINKDYLQNKINEIEGMKKDLINLKKYRDSDKLQLKIVKKGLEETSKEFGIDRKTQVKKFDIKEDIIEEIQTIQQEEAKNVAEVIVTKQGFIYKNYKKQDIKLSPNDEVVGVVRNLNDNGFVHIVFKDNNSSLGIPVKDIKPSTTKAIGQHTNNFNNEFKDSEPILIVDMEETKDIVYVFDNGKAVRFNGSQFNFKRKMLKNVKAEGCLLYADVLDYEYSLILRTEKRKKDITLNTVDIAKKQSKSASGNIVTRNKIIDIE